MYAYVYVSVGILFVLLNLVLMWKQEQKEAVNKGLITMQDVEMAVAEGMLFHCLVLTKLITFKGVSSC